MKWWQHKDHPLWRTVNTLATGSVILAVFAASQWVTNVSFDQNELEAVGLSAGGLTIAALVRKFLA